MYSIYFSKREYFVINKQLLITSIFVNTSKQSLYIIAFINYFNSKLSRERLLTVQHLLGPYPRASLLYVKLFTSISTTSLLCSEILQFFLLFSFKAEPRKATYSVALVGAIAQGKSFVCEALHFHFHHKPAVF